MFRKNPIKKLLEKSWRDKETEEEFRTKYFALWNRHRNYIKTNYNGGNLIAFPAVVASIGFPFFRKAYLDEIERIVA